ncbi:DUF3093 domain-containing protein [Longivirga aurantiaca]|uniref:DUF3093 domain-containing protein n=1 Tax=Longivirga aurantiaca TaxID=1837743 RepID=A0ABW1T1T9_9ACTN
MASTQPTAEGLDGSVVAYRERLHAPWWMWLLGTVLMLTLGVAYGFRLGAVAGVITFVVAEAVLAALLLVTAPLVVVDDAVLRAGRARLPLRHVGRVAVFDAARTRDARGTRGDKRAYLCLRGWVPASVLVEVDDPDDPHPYWLVSTRRGRELAPVLAAARDAARDVAG